MPLDSPRTETWSNRSRRITLPARRQCQPEICNIISNRFPHSTHRLILRLYNHCPHDQRKRVQENRNISPLNRSSRVLCQAWNECVEVEEQAAGSHERRSRSTLLVRSSWHWQMTSGRSAARESIRMRRRRSGRAISFGWHAPSHLLYIQSVCNLSQIIRNSLECSLLPSPRGIHKFPVTNNALPALMTGRLFCATTSLFCVIAHVPTLSVCDIWSRIWDKITGPLCVTS